MICVCRVDDIIRCESTINKDQASFPEHNYNNILKVWTNTSNINAFLSSLGDAPRARKQYFIIQLLLCSHLQYLSYCMTLCPRAYSDEELLLLLTVVNKVSLDTQLILQPSVALVPVQYKILYNIRNWTAMVSPCISLLSLTEGSDAMQKK